MSVHYNHFLGALYDFDDTLLSNQPSDGNPYNLHERSRLVALHALAKKHNLPTLLEITDEENNAGFLEAREHSLDSALWTILRKRGVIPEHYDTKNPLVLELMEAKAVLHLELLKTFGFEVDGASDFVRAFEAHGLDGKQAIASGARHEEIEVFVERYDLGKIFPKERIIARGDFRRFKPDPDCFDTAYATLALADGVATRRRVLAVEDDPKGVASAQAAGLYVAVVTTRFPAEVFQALTQAPDVIAADFVDLAAKLKLPLAKD